MDLDQRFHQFFALTSMGGDYDPEKQKSSQYREAMNMFMSQDGNVVALKYPGGDTLINHTLPVGQQWHQMWSCKATYGENKEVRDSIFLMSRNPSTGDGFLWILDSTTDRIYKIYDDTAQPDPYMDGLGIEYPNDRRYKLLIGNEVDCLSIQDGDYNYAFWVDNTNPPRYVRLHVSDPTVEDNSVPGKSPLYVANEPDCLWMQRLWPGPPIAVIDVNDTGGSVLSGSYQFAYRYWNSDTRRYSCWSLITNELPIFEADINTNTSNTISGSAPLSKTSKSVTLYINRTGNSGNSIYWNDFGKTPPEYHPVIYNSIQLAVIRRSPTNLSSVTVELLRPSDLFYQSESFVYTGNESVLISSEDELTIDGAEIEIAKTIEEDEGRIYLANIKYYDLEIPDVVVQGETELGGLYANPDPFGLGVNRQIGYADPINVLNQRGYFREEVYRFGRTYMNKFGFFARPKPFDFSDPSNKYDPEDITNTWGKSWSKPGNPDWKFSDRQNAAASLVDYVSADYMSIFGMLILGINKHPSWARGMAIVRLPRKKNILGQSPVINGVAINGGATWLGQDAVAFNSKSFSFNYFEEDNGLWDYNGKLDTYEPKMLSKGHAKHISYLRRKTSLNITDPTAAALRRYQWQRLVTKLQGNKVRGVSSATFATDTVYSELDSPLETYQKEYPGILYMYPLEVLANMVGEYATDNVKLDGTEKIKIIDAMAFVGFNGFRDNSLFEGMTEEQDFESGNQSKYAWVFSTPNKGHHYYYYPNGHNPGDLLNPSAANSIYQAPAGEIPISGGWKTTAAGQSHVSNKPLSRHEDLLHVKNINGLDALIKDQTVNDNDIWDGYRIPVSNPAVNTPSLAIQIPFDEGTTGDNTVKVVYDPTRFVYDKYTTGGTQTLLTDVFDVSETINVNAVTEDLVSGSSDIKSDGDVVANTIIPNGSSIVLYIANILAGLDDDRYGPLNQSNGYIFTGFYTPITGYDAANDVSKNANVYGGDCYVTKLHAQVRTNGFRIARSNVKDAANKLPLAFDDTPFTTFDVSYVDKVSGYRDYAEWITCWVESEVNGELLIRGKDQYPSGILGRQTANQNTNAFPKYEYPLSGLPTYTEPMLYQYDFGGSAENDLKRWVGYDPTEVKISKFPARVVWSDVKVYQNPDSFFDKFLVLNYYDLSPAMGEINSILRSSTNKHIIVQDDGIAMIYIGRSLVEDADGKTISLGTGTVIGYATYLSDNHKSGGDIGGQFLRTSKRTGTGVAVFDNKRGKMVMVGEGMQDVTIAQVEDFINRNIGQRYEQIPAGGMMTLFDNINRRVIVYRQRIGNDYGKGLVYNYGFGAWEGGIDTGASAIKDLATSGQDVYAAVNINNLGSSVSSESRIIKLYNGASDTLLGTRRVSILLVINNQEHASRKKVVSSITIHASADPGTVRISTENNSGVIFTSLPVTYSTKRGNVYIYNRFLSSGKDRIRGENIYIHIENENPEKGLVIHSVEAVYRIDTER